jgi:hypothetical protein
MSPSGMASAIGVDMTDTNKNIFLCITALDAGLDCDREHSEKTLDALETDLFSMTLEQRSEVRRNMICIVAQLSRLEGRLMGQDGPLRPEK